MNRKKNKVVSNIELEDSKTETEIDIRKSAVISMTIRDVINLMQLGYINCQPDYQRDEVWSRQWAQKLMDTIFKELDMPKLYFRNIESVIIDKINNGEQVKLTDFDKISTMDVIDGQQRLTAILSYFNDGFPTSSKYKFRTSDSETKNLASMKFSKLKESHPDIYEKFLDYELDVSLFFGNTADVYNQYLVLNDSNNMVAVQKRMAIPSAGIRYINELSHPRKENNHPVFEVAKAKNGKLKTTLKYINMSTTKFSVVNLLHETVAYMAKVESEKKKCNWVVKGISDGDIVRMFTSVFDDEVPVKFKNKIESTLNRLYEMLKDEKYFKQTGKGTILNIVILLTFLEQKYPSKNQFLIDEKAFAKWFFELDYKLRKLTKAKRDSGMSETIFNLRSRMGKDSDALEFRRKTLVKYFDKELKSMTSKFGKVGNTGITIKDSKRTITDNEAIEVYHFQDGIDSEGNPLKQSEMVKAHRVAHSNGGESTIENTVMTTKSANRIIVADQVVK